MEAVLTRDRGPDWGLVAAEARLDALRVTARGIAYDAVVDALLGAVPGSQYRRKDKGHGTPRLALIEVPDDNSIGVRWRDLGDCYVDVQGPLASVVRQVAIDLAAKYRPPAESGWPQSIRVSRIDACLDFDHPGAFEAAVSAARSHLASLRNPNRPAVDQRGDWENPVAGRTLYVGSRQSVLLRIYEKGRQLRAVKGIEGASDHHIRVEVEAHPADRAAFEALHWSPLVVLATSSTAIAALRVLGVHLPAYMPSRDAGARSTTVRKLLGLHGAYSRLFWELARRMGSAEVAARVIAATLMRARPTPAWVQRVLDRGAAAPELQAEALGWAQSVDDASGDAGDVEARALASHGVGMPTL